MRPPEIPKKPRMRVDRSTKWQMLILAVIFDSLTLVPKLFMIIGIAGALTVGWIPFFGQLFGVAAIGATTGLNFMFTWLFMFIGYTWMWGWLLTRDVPIFGGHNLEKKALILPFTLLADMMPLIGTLLPGITVWTYTQIRFAEKEDMARHVRAVKQAHDAMRAYQVQVRKLAQLEQRIVSRAAMEETSAQNVLKLRRDAAMSPRTTPQQKDVRAPYVLPHAA